MVVTIKPRKIFPAGGSFQLSLPMVWIRHHKLHRGSVVMMKINNKSELEVKPCK